MTLGTGKAGPEDLVFEWLPQVSSERHDIAVLRLKSRPPGFDPSPLRVALTPDDFRAARLSLSGRRVAFYGFPVQGPGPSDRLIVGTISVGQPLEEVLVTDPNPGSPIGTTLRLRLLAENAYELKGISGAPFFDLELAAAVGVQHSYLPREAGGWGPGHQDGYDIDARLVYGTPLRCFQEVWPDFARDCGAILLDPAPHAGARPPRIVHSLRPARDFRDRPELEEIRRFWLEGKNGGVLGLIGIGGTGKTAVAERFLCELPGSGVQGTSIAKRSDLPAPDSLFVWSFYENPNCEQFFEHLSTYLTRQSATAGATHLDLEALKTDIEDPVHGRRLLVLDGLERIQSEQGVRGAFGHDTETRRALAPVRELLSWTASASRGVWMIATTRFPLVDLVPWEERGYRPVQIDQLPRHSAVRLLRARGVRGSDAEFEALLKELGCHALTVTLLGGLLGTFCDGDPRRGA